MYWFKRKDFHGVELSTYEPKSVKEKFRNDEMSDLATTKQNIIFGIAKVSEACVGGIDYGPYDTYVYKHSVVVLEYAGEKGLEKHDLQYDNLYTQNMFKKGEKIAFAAIQGEDKIYLLMFGKPAELEKIESKVKRAREIGSVLAKIEDITHQIQDAGDLLAKPLSKALEELRDKWGAIKEEYREKKLEEKQAMEDEYKIKSDRETGIYSEIHDHKEDHDIIK